MEVPGRGSCVLGLKGPRSKGREDPYRVPAVGKSKRPRYVEPNPTYGAVGLALACIRACRARGPAGSGENPGITKPRFQQGAAGESAGVELCQTGIGWLTEHQPGNVIAEGGRQLEPVPARPAEHEQSGRVVRRIIGVRDPSGRTASTCSVMLGVTCSGLSASACRSSSIVRLKVTVRFFASAVGSVGETIGTVSSSRASFVCAK